jgi:uncharacterized protein
MLQILITGGTGLVGRYLSDLLQQAGHTVRHLSRRAAPNAKYSTFVWDVEKGYIDPRALENVDAIVHLAGEGIADRRWTAARRRAIIDSRTQSTALLARAIAEQSDTTIKTFVAASAIGFYGERGDELLDEQSAVGSDFMAETCQDWEDSNKIIREMGIRCPRIRIGIVLSTKGGALAKMLPSYRFRIGAYFGSGKQHYSWIHIHDLARVLQYAIENPALTDVYNATAPNSATNYELAAAIAKARDKKTILLPVPAFALRLALGDMAAVVLTSANVAPKALLTAGFQFGFPELLPALKDILEGSK